MKRALSTVSVVVLLACNGLTTPPVGPGSEYPCGVSGVVCSSNHTSAICCDHDSICGFDGPFTRCPAGQCCYDGPDWFEASHQIVPQRAVGR